MIKVGDRILLLLDGITTKAGDILTVVSVGDKYFATAEGAYFDVGYLGIGFELCQNAITPAFDGYHVGTVLKSRRTGVIYEVTSRNVQTKICTLRSLINAGYSQYLNESWSSLATDYEVASGVVLSGPSTPPPGVRHVPANAPIMTNDSGLEYFEYAYHSSVLDGCQHKWATYNGFTEEYEYCTICDSKRKDHHEP